MDAANKQQQIQHLFWRAGFGATPEVVQRESRKSISKVVRDLLKDSATFKPLALVDESLAGRKELRNKARQGMLDREQLRQQIRQQNEQIRDLNVLWVEKMATGESALREKMAFFWHGHFACRIRNPAAVQQYANTIRQHALGTFSDLLMAVSKEPAMLQFLNNQQNRKNAPNENFAREVMELFTLGRGAYTEHDIKDAARAFTGWGYNADSEFVFRKNQHDAGPKTIFGKTGNFTGEDVIGMLLEQKQTARFITGKLYQFLVNDQPAGNDEVVNNRLDALASQFYSSGYDIAKLLETILTADWFYAPENRGTRIKSPIELLAGMQHSLGIQFAQNQSVVFIQRTLGQVLFYPPNVAGWPGGRSWIDSSSLLFRMRLPDIILKADQLAIRPKGDGDVNTEALDRRGKGFINTQVAWTDFEKNFEKVSDDTLPDALAHYLLQQPLGQTQRDLLFKRIKTGSSRSEQIKSLTITLMAFPEYQLC
ncbi:DUF1800 domain-containing protein [Tellurirhabdus bombi]|uniref:DUF1800 domain-containing protein n=1 Tax=Tellurirhabdus bombi TaxID=2907205 RepID=UPI001F37B97C|nr:DUF1800 domain-containing protein [Tellurirhabdus bombi]